MTFFAGVKIFNSPNNSQNDYIYKAYWLLITVGATLTAYRMKPCRELHLNTVKTPQSISFYCLCQTSMVSIAPNSTT